MDYRDELIKERRDLEGARKQLLTDARVALNRMKEIDYELYDTVPKDKGEAKLDLECEIA